MIKWIQIEDGLPDYHVSVLVYNGVEMFQCKLIPNTSKNKVWVKWDYFHGISINPVTHWAELPNKPNPIK